MTLIQIKRRFSVLDTYINLDAIDSIYVDHSRTAQSNNSSQHNVLLRSGVVYDVTEDSFNMLIRYVKEKQ